MIFPSLINSFLAAIITLIFGPLTFYIWSHYFIKNNLKKSPLGINDGLGDIIFLPLFNAILFYLGFSFENIFFSILISFIITLGYYLIDIKGKDVNWSKPKTNKYNLGGYYHLLFFFCQTILIIHGLIYFYYNYLIWVSLTGYLLTVILQIRINGHW